eukprot:PhF_6_TR35706/c0_g1_i1/m.51841
MEISSDESDVLDDEFRHHPHHSNPSVCSVSRHSDSFLLIRLTPILNYVQSRMDGTVVTYEQECPPAWFGNTLPLIVEDTFDEMSVVPRIYIEPTFFQAVRKDFCGETKRIICWDEIRYGMKTQYEDVRKREAFERVVINHTETLERELKNRKPNSLGYLYVKSQGIGFSIYVTDFSLWKVYDLVVEICRERRIQDPEESPKFILFGGTYLYPQDPRTLHEIGITNGVCIFIPSQDYGLRHRRDVRFQLLHENELNTYAISMYVSGKLCSILDPRCFEYWPLLFHDAQLLDILAPAPQYDVGQMNWFLRCAAPNTQLRFTRKGKGLWPSHFRRSLCLLLRIRLLYWDVVMYIG